MTRPSRSGACLVSAALVTGLLSVGSPASIASPAQARSSARAPTKASALSAYGHLPAVFEPNVGQADPGILYLSRSGGLALALTNSAAVLSMRSESGPRLRRGDRDYPHSVPAKAAVLSMSYSGADPNAPLQALRPLMGTANYLLGSDPTTWHTDVPTYGGLVYRGLYPGIDLSFAGASSASGVEYTFTVAPGADPAAIRLAFSGQRSLALDHTGRLTLGIGSRTLVESPPVITQGSRRISGGYRMLPGGTVGFRLGSYDRTKPLVIDPVLSYSTYLGGTSDDIARSVAVDSAGDAYITGFTLSTNFPVLKAYQSTNKGGYDVFLSKLNPAGTRLIYSTYIGGTGDDEAGSLHLDPSNRVYLTGVTSSTNYPITSGAFQTTNKGGPWDAFVTKVNSSGNALNYSTYLGWSSDDEGYGVTMDATGTYPIVTGTTNSGSFPHTTGAFQTTKSTSYDAFVTKVNPNPSQPLLYSTFLGGNGVDKGFGIALNDSSSRIVVTGQTKSTNFPLTTGAFQTTNHGGYDAFLSKFNAAGSILNYSTYLGGGLDDVGWGVTVDASGYAYVAGATASTNFPHTTGAYQTVLKGTSDLTITKVNQNASQPLVFSTYLGGTADEAVTGVALDATKNVYVNGVTDSYDFPITADAVQPFSGVNDVTQSELNPTGTSLLSSTYLGGNDDDESTGLAIDAGGNLYVTGLTLSTTFPTAETPFQPAGGGSTYDGFVTKLAAGTPVRSIRSSSGFDNPSLAIHLGDGVAWVLASPYASDDQIVDGSGLSLFGSGFRPQYSTYSHVFAAAGTYPVAAGIAAQSVNVPDSLSASTGNPTSTFSVTWARAAPPSGDVYDVQIQRPGTTSFANWMTGVSSLLATFVPDGGDGTYLFQSRIRNTTSGAATGYSTPAPISVTGVGVFDAGFSPSAATSTLGAQVTWYFAPSNTTSHSATDHTGLGLFDSGPKAAGTSFTYAFPASGTYSVIDTTTNSTSTISVPLYVAPSSYPATSFLVNWGSPVPPPGDVYDVQVEVPGSASFQDWQTGVTSFGGTYTPSATGLYQFRGRVRASAGGAASDWSTPSPASVSDWTEDRYDSSQANAQPVESWINPTTITSLHPAVTLNVGSSESSKAIVVAGRVYVSDSTKIYALDAASGNTLWYATSSNVGALSVVGGRLYSGSPSGVSVFDSAGVTNCSGSPTLCQPLWTGSTGTSSAFSVVVAGADVIASTSQKVYAFDASGVTNCSGTPKTCQPLWRASVAGSAPAVSSGSVFTFVSQVLNAYDLNGVKNCSGTPLICKPEWSSAALIGKSFRGVPVAADGRVFVGDSSGGIQAYDAAGATNCSGAPLICMPLWRTTVWSGSPVMAIAGGRIYTTDGDGVFEALDDTNGVMVWKGGTSFDISNSQVVEAGGVVFGTEMSGLMCPVIVARSALDGQLLWTASGCVGGYLSEAAGVLFVSSSGQIVLYHP
jgi:plastocyanin